MLPPRRSPTATADLARLDDLVAAIRREIEQAEADPFDDAMVAAVAGLAEVTKAQATELADLRRRMIRLARQSPA